MQTDHNPDGGRGASLSRRKFFQIAAASTAATLPVAASASAVEKTSRLPQLTDEQQLENCISQLRDVLQRMHPMAVKIHPHFLKSGEDGRYEFHMEAGVIYQSFSGDGLYEVSLMGHVYEFWLEQDCRRHFRTGEPIAGAEFYRATMRLDGTYCGEVRHMCLPSIVRKIEGGVSPWSE